MFVLVTGDRWWTNYYRIYEVLRTLPRDTTIITGWANGADTIADQVAYALGFTRIRRPAHWRHNDVKWVEIHGPCPDDCREICGPPAGPIRNGAMLSEFPQIELVLAFHNDLMKSKGTKDMMYRAMKKKIKRALFTDTDQILYAT